MCLIRFSREGGPVRPGYLTSGTVFDLSDRAENSSDLLVELEMLPSLLAGAETISQANVSLHTPTVPSKIIRLVGCYEHDTTDEGFDPHAEAAGFTDMATPSLWVAPTSTLTAHESVVVLPQQVDTVVPGVELVAVVGQEAHELSVGEALDAVAGYTTCIDVAVQDETPGLEGYKMFESFLPTGPTVVPADEIEPESLGIGLRNNGTPEDNRSTTELRFSMAEILRYVSNVMTLYPGDIVTIGSPLRSVSPVEDGDKLAAWIESIGTLRVTVRSEDEQ